MSQVPAREPYPPESTTTGELQEMQLPTRPESGTETAERLERQLDHLIDLLAADRLVTKSQPPGGEGAGDRLSQRPDDLSSVEAGSDLLELSIVMPCLDEAQTIGTCVLKALYAIDRMGISGEVVVADNGSRDDSVQIAQELGARVVHVDEPGYGAALMGGIAVARGRFILMGDADDSCDFSKAHQFYEKLCRGAELVQGCRLRGGGGRVMPGAMPWLQQLGHPVVSWLARRIHRAPTNDVTCGMRGFTKELYQRLDQRCTGTDFATEMIVKSARCGASMEEVPIVMHARNGQKRSLGQRSLFRQAWMLLRWSLA